MGAQGNRRVQQPAAAATGGGQKLLVGWGSGEEGAGKGDVAGGTSGPGGYKGTSPWRPTGAARDCSLKPGPQTPLIFPIDRLNLHLTNPQHCCVVSLVKDWGECRPHCGLPVQSLEHVFFFSSL